MREMVAAYGKPAASAQPTTSKSTSSKSATSSTKTPAPSKPVPSKPAPGTRKEATNLKKIPSGKITTSTTTTKPPNKDTDPRISNIPSQPTKPAPKEEEPRAKTTTTTHSTTTKTTKSSCEPEVTEEPEYKPKLGFPKEFVEEMAKFRENRKHQAMYETRPTDKVFMDKINEYSSRKTRKMPRAQGLGSVEAQLIAKRMEINKISIQLLEILQSSEWKTLVEAALNVNPREITSESAEVLFRAWFTMESIKHTYTDMKTAFEEASVHPVEAYTDKCLNFLLRENKTIPVASPRESNPNTTSPLSPKINSSTNDGIGSCSWINWWLPPQYSSGKDILSMLSPKETPANDQGKKIFSYDSLKSLQNLNEYRHTLQLRLFHQHIQDKVTSLLLPILNSMPVNDKRYISLFCLVHSLLCNDRCNGQELCAFLPAELGT